MEVILKRVRSARTKLVAGSGLRWLVRGLFWVGLAAALLVFAQRWTGPLPSFVWPALGAGLIAFSAGLALRGRPSLRSAAIELDRAAGLEDRLGAALFVLGEDTPVARALRRDAQEALQRAGKTSIPLPTLPLKRLALPAVLLLAALTVPAPGGRAGIPGRQLPARLQSLVPEPLRKEESERLRRRAFSLEKQARELGRPELQELAEALRKAAEELRKESLTRNEALAKLSSLEEQSRGKKDSIAARLPESLLKRMKGQGGQADKASELKKADLAKKLSELSQAAGQLKEKLSQGALSPEEQARLDEQLKELSAALGKELGEGLPDDLQSRLDKLLEDKGGNNAQQLAQALGDLKSSLNDLETLSLLESELDEMLAAKDGFSDTDGSCLSCGKSLQGQTGGTCQGCSALAGNEGGTGSGGGPGSGSGGGPGRGPKGAAQDGDSTTPSRPQAALNPGEIISAIQFKSLPEKGQLRSAYTEAYRALSAEAAQALQQEEIPAAYRLHVRDYFDSIRPDKSSK